MAEQMRQGDDAPDQVLAAIFFHTRLDVHAGMTSNGYLTANATPWAKQFRDDIESLRHIDEGDGLAKRHKRGHADPLLT